VPSIYPGEIDGIKNMSRFTDFIESHRIAMRTGGVAYLLFGDHLGSSSLLVRADGTIAEKAYYLPWGGARGEGAITSTDYGYTGQMREGDIYYYGARWPQVPGAQSKGFDPAIGRFMQADKIVPLQVQGTQAFDRYAYVNNNPMKYIDPSGNYACDANGDCYIGGWTKDYLIKQTGNTCNIVAMAMAMSTVTGVKFEQSALQPYFPSSYVGIGILPWTLSTTSSIVFSDKIRVSVDFDGNFEKIDTNLENDFPTIILFGLPEHKSIGHYVVIVGKSMERGYIIADPHGIMRDETEFIKRFGESRGLNSFEDIWGYEGQAIVNNFTMITVSPSYNNWLHVLTKIQPRKPMPERTMVNREVAQ